MIRNTSSTPSPSLSATPTSSVESLSSCGSGESQTSPPIVLTIDQSLHNRNLTERQMPADGNCLFHAVLDQLKQNNIHTYVVDDGSQRSSVNVPETAAELRQLAAPVIRSVAAGHGYTAEQLDQMVDEASAPSTYRGASHDYLPAALAKLLGANLTVVCNRYIDDYKYAADNYAPQLTIVHRQTGGETGVVGHYNSTAPANLATSKPPPVPFPAHQVRQEPAGAPISTPEATTPPGSATAAAGVKKSNKRQAPLAPNHAQPKQQVPTYIYVQPPTKPPIFNPGPRPVQDPISQAMDKLALKFRKFIKNLFSVKV